MMKLVLTLVLLASATPAAAEVWGAREGECGEYRARWDVDQEVSGVWVGEITHTQVGGPCSPATGAQDAGEVRAMIAGEDFFAMRTGSGLCTYYGRIAEDRVRGFVLCDGKPTRHAFALRFPAGGDRSSQPRRDVPPTDDEFLSDPRQFERERVPRGFGRR